MSTPTPLRRAILLLAIGVGLVAALLVGLRRLTIDRDVTSVLPQQDPLIADANYVLFFNRDEVHRVSHPVPGGDDCTDFAYAPEVLAEAIGRYEPAIRDRPAQPFSFTHAPTGPDQFLFHQRLRKHLRSACRDEMAAEQGALDLLDSVIAGAYGARGRRSVRMKPDTARIHRETADAARIVLARRFRERLSLTDVARSVHCSPYHLARLFRRNVGQAVHQYQNRLRLRAALEQISEGRNNLTDLALDLGFSSHSHFTEAFRREFTLLPSQVRRTASRARLREMSRNLTV